MIGSGDIPLETQLDLFSSQLQNLNKQNYPTSKPEVFLQNKGRLIKETGPASKENKDQALFEGLEDDDPELYIVDHMIGMSYSFNEPKVNKSLIMLNICRILMSNLHCVF